MNIIRTIAAAIGLFTAASAVAAAQEVVDLELLIAIDASGSVNAEEFELQMGGVAAAFRDPEVHEAIASGPEQKIAAAIMLWADARSRKAFSDWRIIDSPAAAHSFADLSLAQIGRRGSFLGNTGTGIGAAIGAGVEAIRKNGVEAARRTIDVSGDGHETRLMFGEGMMLPEAHRRAARRDVTVNGLAILSDDPHLATYYEARVIRGPGAFAVVANGFEDFERAMKLKLLREIRQLVGEASSTKQATASYPHLE